MVGLEGGVREESSLSLKEKIDEFLESLSIKWQEFLDWSDDKGLPLRKINDFFEEKGIPALPAMLIFVLLLISGIYIAFISFSATPVKTFVVSVKSADGSPLTNASVQFQFSTSDGFKSKFTRTDQDGKAIFTNVPSTTASITVNAVDYQQSTRQVEISNGDDSKTFAFSLTPASVSFISLSVTINGPPIADVILYSGNGSIISTNNATALAQFEVDANANYTVVAKATGFREESKIVQIGSTNFNLPIRLFRDGEERVAPIYVRVYKEDGRTPIANATVKALGEATGTQLATGVTGEDGAAPSLDLPIGANVSVTVTADGYLTWLQPTVTITEPQVALTARLVQRTAENSKNVVITVIDGDGKPLSDPQVVLYCDKLIETKHPASGVAGFDVEVGHTCLAAVSKDGYLPVQRELTSASEQTVILHQASSANSGTVLVQTLDKKGNSVGGIDVALFLNSKPFGISLNTQLDGTAKFEFLPLENVTFKASNEAYEGEVRVNVKPVSETGIEGQRVSISLSSAQAQLAIKIIDHFGRQVIQNAVVNLVDSDGKTTSCTTNSTGECFAVAGSGSVSVSITAPGYEALSSKFDASPGASSQSFELISTELSEGTELVFVGMYNNKNERVTVLSPATRYTAKYLLKAPAEQFASAKAFIQVGPSDVDLENGAGTITSYSSEGGSMIAGIDYSATDTLEQSGSLTLVSEDGQPIGQPLTTLTANGDLTPTSQTSGTSASISRGKFKWVQVTFATFTGTKEIKVQIETSPIQEGNVELFHRTEYALTLVNGSLQYLRNPADASSSFNSPIWQTLSPEPTVIPIHFEGKCTEGTCVELWFEGASGKTSAFSKGTAQFTAVVPETFKLNYRILMPPSFSPFSSSTSESPSENALQKVAVSLQTDSEALELLNENTSTRQVEAGSEGFYALKALRASNDAVLGFSAGDSAEELHVSVSNAGNTLAVNVDPATPLIAFQENTVKFTIRDKNGAIVENAKVVLQKSQSLLTQVEAQEEKPGEFTALVTPASFDGISYAVQAKGFPTKKGKLTVTVKDLVSVEPKTNLAVSINSLDKTPGSAFTITNLVPNKEVKVSIILSPNTAPKYSSVGVDLVGFKLKGGESKSIILTGQINSNVIPFAVKANTLKETLDGKIIVNAKTAGHSQSTNLDFKADAVYQQEPLDQLLDYSADSLDFTIDLPLKRRDEQLLQVTNKATKSVLVNQQSIIDGVRVSPVSAIIPPGQSFDFKVTASPSLAYRQTQCFFEDQSDKGSLEFTASFQGLSTSKSIQVNVGTSSKQRCTFPGSVALNLPMDVNFLFPPGTFASKNPAIDGSQAVRLPNGEPLVFQQGSFVSDQRAQLPAGSSLELLGMHVAQNPVAGGQDFRVGFPVPVFINIPLQAQQTNTIDGSVKFSFLGVEITLPPGVQQAQFNQFSSPFDQFGGSGQSAFNSFSGSQSFNNQPLDPYRGFGSQTGFQQFGSNFAGRFSYAIPAGAPIRVTLVADQSAGEPFEIGYDETVYLDLPLDSQTQQNGATINAILSTCTQLSVYTKATDRSQQIRDVLPSARQVTIMDATLSGKTVKLDPGGRIRIQMCTGVDEEQKLFQTKLRAPTTFVLPPGTPDPRSTAMHANYPNCAELVYRGGYSLGVASVKKAVFPQSSKVAKAESDSWEVSAPQGETVQLMPCRSLTPAISSFGGNGIEARTENGQPVEFTFTEKDIGKQKTYESICLINKRKGIVSPRIDSNYLSTPEGTRLIEAAPQLTLPSTQGSATYDLSPSQNNQCNNKFKLTLSMPTSVVKDGCIVDPSPEGGFTGNLVFAAVDSTGWSGTAKLPVKIKVIDSGTCKRQQNKIAFEFLNTFYIDYDSQNTNERTNGQFVFTFKGVGEDHKRRLTMVNNFGSTLAVTTTGNAGGSSAISCPELSKTLILAPGEAKAIECTPVKATSEAQQLKITATGGGQVFDRTVKVQVYAGDPAIYQSSPWGELAPGAAPKALSTSTATLAASSGIASSTPTSTASTTSISFAGDETIGRTSGIQATSEPVGLLGTCAKHYCNYDQAGQAFNQFLTGLANIVTEKTSDAQVQAQLCAPGGQSGKYVKTMILHLANTKRDFSQKIRAASIQGMDYGVENADTLTGCGIYQITAQVDVCSGTALGTDGRRAASKIRIIGGQRLASCPHTLANAPLFLAGKDEDLAIFIGNKIGAGLNDFDGVSSLLGILSLGPYMEGENQADKKTTFDLLQTIYGENPAELPSAFVPQNYNNPTFCMAKGGKQIAAIAGGTVVLGVGAALTGIGSAVGARLAYGATQALIACVISTGAQGIAELVPGEHDFVCSSMNACVRSAIFGAISTVVPGAQIATALKSSGAGIGAAKVAVGSGKSIAIYAGVATAATVGAELYTHLSDDSPLSSPGTAGPTAYAASRTIVDPLYGTAAAKATASTQAIKDVIASLTERETALLTAAESGTGPHAVEEVRSWILANKDGKVIISGNANPSAFGQLANPPAGSGITPNAFTDAEKLALQQKINLLTGTEAQIRAGTVVEGLLKSKQVLDDTTRLALYEKLLTTKPADYEKIIKSIFDSRLKDDRTLIASLRASVQQELTAAHAAATAAATASGAAAPAAPTAAQIQQVVDDRLNSMVEKLSKEVVTEAEAAVKPATVAALSRAAKFKQFGKALLPALLQIGVQLGLDVDVRPNQAVVSPNARNVLVVYHIEDPISSSKLPSIHKFCTQDETGNCNEPKSFYLANLCNSDTDACIVQNQVDAASDSYQLFVVMNNPNIPPKMLFDTLMLPETNVLPELKGNFKFTSLTSGDIASLKGKPEDEGDGKALESASSTSTSQQRTVAIGG